MCTINPGLIQASLEQIVGILPPFFFLFFFFCFHPASYAYKALACVNISNLDYGVGNNGGDKRREFSF